MRRANDLLRHHQVVRRPVHALGALNVSDSVSTVDSLKTCWSWTRYFADTSETPNAGCEVSRSAELFDLSLSGWILAHFRAVALESHHASAYSHDLLLSSVLETRVALVLALHNSILVSKPTVHHAWVLLTATVHHDVIFLDNCDAVHGIVLAALWLRWCRVVLLSLNHLATKHLRVFYFNLRVVENVIVVVYVFDDFYWLLLLALLFWLWWAWSSSMDTMHHRMSDDVARAEVFRVVWVCVSLVAWQLSSVVYIVAAIVSWFLRRSLLIVCCFWSSIGILILINDLTRII